MKSIADAKCKQEIVGRIGRMRPDAPRQWGKMTAPQMICHLNDAFLGVMGQQSIAPTFWPICDSSAVARHPRTR